jgi:hypothetical protein
MPPELVAQIRTTDANGDPTDVVLATSEAVAISDVTHDGFYNFTFTTPVTLPDTATDYAVVLLKQNPESGDADIGWIGSTAENPYSEGAMYRGTPWTKFSNDDFFFKVFYSAPAAPTVVENVVQLDQDNADRWFVSTDNTMELDMRFMTSFCIDGTGSMIDGDPNDIRNSEAYLFSLEVMRRAPLGYIDVWTFSDVISEYTYDGPTADRALYAAAFGSIDSTGVESRLWAAAEQSIGNCEADIAVQAIVRDEEIPKVLDLMRQMNRIDYDELAEIDPTYDASTGYAGIAGHGRAIDFIIQTYAETMGRVAIVISDGFDDSDDTDAENVITLANAVAGDQKTPVSCFAIGDNHDSTDMVEISEGTSGISCEIGGNIDRLRESLNLLLNDSDHTIFQGWYEDTVTFDELTFIEEIELGAIIPLTSNLTFQISVSYDGVTYADWETISANSRHSLKRFVWGFKYKIGGWLGNVYGGNYYDIYGFQTGEDNSTAETIGCRFLRYYYYDSYEYATESTYYYYRDIDYPSPKVYSLRYWTVDPAITYRFTDPTTGGPISEYVLAPTVDLPETAILNWGIIRGNSADFGDAESVIVNRRGVLPNRLSEIYYTPDVERIGLSAEVQDQSYVLYKVLEEDGTTATWESTDELVVFSGNNELDPDLVIYQGDGERGYILFAEPRSATDVITVNITEPGEASVTQGEICTTLNRRTYFAKNGPWPWDATVVVRIGGAIRRDGYITDPSSGTIFFMTELDPTSLVTVEINHATTYRVAYELKEYDQSDPIDPPDFGILFSRTTAEDSLFEAGLTSIPVASNVTLLPSNREIDETDPDAIISIDKTARLIVSYDFYQEENNAEAGSSIEWYVKHPGDPAYSHYSSYDGRNVQRTSEVTAVNPTGPFREGDLWYVEVTPRDVNSTGETERSNIIRIGTKIPPYITAATITAIEGDDDLVEDDDGNYIGVVQDLEAVYTYVDPNLTGDQTASDASTIEWYNKSDTTSAYTGSQADRILPSRLIEPGDVWSYIIAPYDGVNYGDEYESIDVTITNEDSATTT